MIAAQEHKKELERLKNLTSYSILDTLPEEDYDNLTTIAAEICDTPISLISLVDKERQWFKSNHGLGARQTPREYAFCAHAINDSENMFIIQDARKDNRFHDNPLVTGEPHVIFYAGIPLISDEGYPLGTLCVIDHKPKELNQNQIQSLSALSKQVMNLLELRKSKYLLEQTLVSLKEKNEKLDRFALLAAHDFKSPLIEISYLTQIFSEEYASRFDERGKEMLDLMNNSSDRLRRLIEGLLDYSRSDCNLQEQESNINLEVLKNNLISILKFNTEFNLILNSNLKQITIHPTIITQILLNLITNAVKYNDKTLPKIEIGVADIITHYQFYVRDNGPGISPKHFNNIFKIFEVLTQEDRFGQRGNGIGLANVKKMVEQSGGTIHVESELGKGTTFRFTIEKVANK